MSRCLHVISLFLNPIPRSTRKAVVFVTLSSNSLLTISYSNIIVTTMMRITALRRRYTNYGYLQHKEELNLPFKQQVPSKNIDEAT